jgi:hypothetical protein
VSATSASPVSFLNHIGFRRERTDHSVGLQNSPQALHNGWPSRSLLHNGVVCVEQLVQVVGAPQPVALLPFELSGGADLESSAESKPPPAGEPKTNIEAAQSPTAYGYILISALNPVSRLDGTRLLRVNWVLLLFLIPMAAFLIDNW